MDRETERGESFSRLVYPLLNLMPQAIKSRSPAQKNQTASLHVSRVTENRRPDIDEDELEARILQLKDKVKDLQQELRNERKRSKRTKIARLRDAQRQADKENAGTRAPEQDAEAERLREKLSEVENQLERQKKKANALGKRVSRFPEQKLQAIQKALRRSDGLAQGSWLRIKTKSGRISTPARRIVRELVLRHKVPTSQAGAVLCIVAGAGPDEEISTRSSRRFVAEVGVGNKLRVAGEVRKAVGKSALKRRGM
jgi:hypothetical protein